MSKRRILVTSALPYANGAIHLGHLVEYIQTDIWVRFQKMCGHEVHYVCADDTHGTPIMLKADSEGITPEALIERVNKEHQRDFAGFLIGFDHYGSTNSPENKTLSENIYLALQQQGLIEVRPVEQYFDPVKNMFLPDRFIKGTCPKCGAQHQYGDSCESCGATYSPTDLIHPYSTVSGAAPIRKSSDHYFFKLSDPRCEQFLREWTQTHGRLQPEAAKKMQEWLGEDGEGKLSDWDISRDAPYFGFEIPNAPGKFFYVWLDAPVGYFASFLNRCQTIHLDPTPFLETSEDTEMVHFIGKDILYFHALFWPAMLQFSGYRTPSQINAHGFLTINGTKMSKSRGTFITAQSYLDEQLNPEWLRYYFAAKLNNSIEDIDLNFNDFTARVNSDLVGKYINIASRSAGFIHKRFGGLLHPNAVHHPLVLSIQQQSNAIKTHYNAREFSRAVRDIMHCADTVNAFVDEQKPWDLAKTEGQEDALQLACSVCLECFRLLSIYLAPILPNLTQQVEKLLGCTLNTWDAVQVPIKTNKPIAPFKHIMQRLEPQQIERLLNLNNQNLSTSHSH